MDGDLTSDLAPAVCHTPHSVNVGVNVPRYVWSEAMPAREQVRQGGLEAFKNALYLSTETVDKTLT